MAMSKVMVSTAPTNPDLPRNSPSSSSLIHHLPNHNSLGSQSSHLFGSTDQISGLGSMNMDDLLRNMYTEPSENENGIGGAVGVDGGGGAGAGAGGGGGGEVGWGEIGNGIGGDGGGGAGGEVGWGEVGNGGRGRGVENGGGGGGEGGEGGWGEIGNGGSNVGRMTLEAYLAKAGAVTEEDVRVSGDSGTGNFGMEGLMNSVQYQGGMAMQNCQGGGFGVEVEPGGALGFGNGMVAVGGTSGGGGRGKRRAVADAPLDKATQQRQRRMIKNRESAARSRERKQAYTVELEALVTRLEEENARLLKEEAELKKQRFKQLMEVKPAAEKRRPPKAVMHRSRSMNW